MGEIEKFIKNKAFRVHDKVKEIIPSVNGIIDNDIKNIYALGSIHRATMSLESFVDVIPSYPEQDSTEVIFETDLMVMKASHYKRLIEMISKLEGSTYKMDDALEMINSLLEKKNGNN